MPPMNEFNTIVFNKGEPAKFTTKKKGQKNKKQSFFRDEVCKLLRSYGDQYQDDDQSVKVLESYVEEYIVNIVTRALERNHRLEKHQIKVADIVRVLNADEKKYLRVPYILTASSHYEKMNKKKKEAEKGGNDFNYKNIAKDQ